MMVLQHTLLSGVIFASVGIAVPLNSPLSQAGSVCNSVSESSNIHSNPHSSLCNSTKDSIPITDSGQNHKNTIVPQHDKKRPVLFQDSARQDDNSSPASTAIETSVSFQRAELSQSLPSTASKRANSPLQRIRSFFPSETMAQRQTALLTCALAFSAGFVDVRAHRTYGCFCNMVTGNTIKLTMALAEWRAKEAAISGAVLVGYVSGVTTARLKKNHGILTDTKSSSSKTSSKPLVLSACTYFAPVILGAFLCADIVTFALPGTKAVQALVQGLAFGMIHTVAQDAAGGTVLFAVTGHWSGIAKFSADSLGPLSSEQSRRTLRNHLRMVGSFIVGIVSSVLFLDRIVPLLPSFPYPVHTITGTMYALLLYWYGSRSFQSKHSSL